MCDFRDDIITWSYLVHKVGGNQRTHHTHSHTHTHTHTLTGGWCVHLWLSPRQQPLPRQWMWQLLCLCMGPQTQEYHQNISSNLLCNLFITSPTPSHPLPHTHSLTPTPSHPLPHTHSLTPTPSHTLPHTHSSLTHTQG